MPNIASIIKAHNKQISTSGTGTDPITCNCRKKDLCPMQGNCQATNIIYNAEVKENNNSQLYIGLTEPPFKLRYNNHTQSFKHEKHQNSTELSKHIWQLKRNKKPFTINWSIASRAQSYNSESKRCNLCLNRKTTHPKRWEALTPEQTTRTHIKVPPWKQILLTQLQKRQYMKHHTKHQ